VPTDAAVVPPPASSNAPDAGTATQGDSGSGPVSQRLQLGGGLVLIGLGLGLAFVALRLRGP